jgi:glycosyltransferase involved in cell wall biosynthesis
LADADLAISPTRWQRSTFPSRYQSMIQVAHEGVDTNLIRPDPAARLRLADGGELSRSDEVVTFVARNLEPLRGYHVFMRALPEILSRRPNAQVIIIGGEDGAYGLSPPEGTSWKSIYLDEVRDQLDLSRVHFMGRVSHQTFLKALQVSSAHVYLTYPFVLSWSMLEAMSAGCVVIGSDTPPVREAIEPDSNGILVPFFAVDELAERVIEALQNPVKFALMRDAARRYVIEHFDAERICVPQMRRLLQQDQEIPAQPEASVSSRDVSDRMPAPPAETNEPLLSAKDRLRNPFT